MIEQAHWYYLDVYRGQDPNLPPYNFKEFATLNILFHDLPNVADMSCHESLMRHIGFRFFFLFF